MAENVGRKGTGKGVSKKAQSKKAQSKKAQSVKIEAAAQSGHPASSQSPPADSSESSNNSGKLTASKKAAAGGANKARLVITHSTYIPGLIKLLEKLARCPEIQTITPAVISRVKSNSPRLRLKVSVPIRGGHKLIARKSKSAQEVFVITHWGKAELEGAIAQIIS